MTAKPYDPWTRHRQSGWLNLTADHTLPAWLRLACYAYGNHRANRHAPLKSGVLAVLLGHPGPSGVEPAARQRVHEAIGVAVRHGWLADGSCSRCLIVPAFIEGPTGDPQERCPVHDKRHG
ncbi:hypothetical protein KV112_04455 [Mycolicibacter sp. MYC123]|uniref:DUF222 domain-containing protein n=1 Tax=[Mycobacterium] zoologicum TaxID=2872311 RepID=A0ABU5YGS1_9MYCO|nr:hypothetical protein [Mycolicibacter sp. MYC123]MEB3049000.1 hypothetical protein [Mycolicibacter sp. MYC123]